jgi:hypothetical protein
MKKIILTKEENGQWSVKVKGEDRITIFDKTRLIKTIERTVRIEMLRNRSLYLKEQRSVNSGPTSTIIRSETEKDATKQSGSGPEPEQGPGPEPGPEHRSEPSKPAATSSEGST